MLVFYPLTQPQKIETTPRNHYGEPFGELND